MIKKSENKETNKRGILIYSTPGYIFHELYKNLIESYYDKYDFHLITDKFFLPIYVETYINELMNNNRIKSCMFVDPHHGLESGSSLHRKLLIYIDKVDWTSIKLFISSTDYNLFDRYLIAKAKSKNCIVINLQAGLLLQIHTTYQNMKKLTTYYLRKIKSMIFQFFSNSFKPILIKRTFMEFLNRYV